MKSKSVSAQNLESLVKQVVNGALEDNEQIIKFRRMIYEEWYFKKWSESKDTNRKKDENISETVVHRRLSGYRFTRKTSTSNDEYLGTTKSLSQNRKKMQETCTDVSAAKVDGRDKALTDENVIEIWYNVSKQPKLKNASNTGSENVRPRFTDNRSSAQRRYANGLSFEAWTANKTLAYREVLKREQRLRRISVSRANTERERKQRLFQRQVCIVRPISDHRSWYTNSQETPVESNTYKKHQLELPYEKGRTKVRWRRDANADYAQRSSHEHHTKRKISFDENCGNVYR